VTLGTVDTPRAHVDRTTEHGFRRDVEGLRAIAIATVVCWHFQLPPFTGGYVGVDVFFVISGFVITRLLLREREQTSGTSLGGFYARRIRRILPAGALTIVVTVIASYLLLGSVRAGQVAHDGIAASLFYANVHFAHAQNSYLLSSALPSPLVHFWSLSIEEQFYLVWPTVLFALAISFGATIHRHAMAIVLGVVTLGSFALSTWMTSHNATNAYYSSLIRAGELALGALVAALAPQLTNLPRAASAVLGWIGVAVVLATAMLYNSQTNYPGLAVTVPVVATAVIIACGCTTSARSPTTLLSLAPVAALGALSYSLYLWHWPLFALVQLRLGHAPSWPWRVALLIPAVLLAITSYRLVEQPIRSSRRLSDRRGRTFAFGATLVAGTLAVIALCNAVAGASGPTVAVPRPAVDAAQLSAALSAASRTISLPALAVPLSQVGNDVPFDGFDRGCLVPFTASTATGNRPHDCFFGDTTAARTLVLYGDSNADMWLGAFDQLGRREHFRVALVARASCQVPNLALWDPAAHAPGTACTAFRRWAVAEVARLHPFATVVVDYEYGLRWDYRHQPVAPQTAVDAFGTTVRRLAMTGTRVVVLGMAPAMFTDPIQCLQTHTGGIGACASPVKCLTPSFRATPLCAFDPATGRTWAQLALLPGAVRSVGGTYVDVSSLFCTTTACPPVVDHLIVNFDLRHVTQHYTEYVAPVLSALISAAGVPLGAG